MASSEEYKKGYEAAIEQIKAALSGQAESTNPNDWPKDLIPPPPAGGESDSSDDSDSDDSQADDSQDADDKKQQQANTQGNQGQAPSKSKKGAANQKEKDKKDPFAPGDPDIQAKEQAEREANSYTDELGRPLDGLGDNDFHMDDDIEEDPDLYKDLSAEERRNFRINKIKDNLSKLPSDENFKKETKAPKQREIEQKREAERAQYKRSSLYRFKQSLDRFIRDAVQTYKDSSWKRFNKNAEAAGFIKKGIARNVPTEIPSINVYFDVSGSWEDADLKIGEETLKVLNGYVDRKEIVINTYYFSTFVDANKTKARQGGGTLGQPILNHIEKTKPQNVVVMTDSDITDCTSNITVPGAVWFLFYGSMSRNLFYHLKGKAQTERFGVDRIGGQKYRE